MARPDFLVIGAPKGGTTALHAVLAQHPELYLSAVKEPKYYLCDGRPPPRSTQRGPGDAHSAQEWIWREREYSALFDVAPAGRLTGESTPFYLYDTAAHARMAADIPNAKLIAILRDPVDRAYSNWTHLRSDGLEPVPDFLDALALEEERIARGWAPFWHYRAMGRYAEQLRSLYEYFPRDQVLLLRYRELVDDPVGLLKRLEAFLGLPPQRAVPAARAENVHPFVEPSARVRVLGGLVRAGASAGSLVPPQVWRRASSPLLKALHAKGVRRPTLTSDERRVALEGLSDDIRELEQVTGATYADWLGETSRGEFSQRMALRDGPAV
jgi:Sulfotransferase family